MTQALHVSLILVIFTIIEGKLMVFLPNKKLPHKLINKPSDLDIIVRKIAIDSVGDKLSSSYLEQLYTFSPLRKNEGIIVSYYLLVQSSFVSQQLKQFVPLNSVIGSQDVSIIEYALQRLRWKIEYTNVVYSLLPEEFTLSELQQVYEIILGETLDKRNFRKKILSLGLLKPSGKKRTGVQARPAKMYEFKTRKPVMVKVFS
jgi:8-oxo-dGTP diphosphatase